jgi:YD repeat-containing protein
MKRLMFLSLTAAIFVLLTMVSGYARDITYSYDGLGRLVSVQYSDGTAILYSYDALGNRTTQTEGAGLILKAAFTASPTSG